LNGEDDYMLSRAREQTRYTPDDAKAWHNLGVALLDRGQLKEAKKAFRKAVDIDPSLKASWSSLYLILMELGEKEEAQKAFVKGVAVTVRDQGTGESKPFDIPEELINPLAGSLAEMGRNLDKGYALMAQGRFDEAEKVFRYVIRNYPDNPRSKLLLADLLVERGKADEALPIIEEAIRAIPESGFPWNVRGRALGKLGRMNEAIESMKRAMEIEPHNRLLKMECERWFREHGI